MRFRFLWNGFFRTNEDWERVAATDFRHVSWSSRTEASLDQVISRPATIILGEARCREVHSRKGYRFNVRWILNWYRSSLSCARTLVT